MAILQTLIALVSKSAGKILNALFGWAVRALFGQTTARQQTYLSVVVGAAVAWPILLIGIVAPRFAAFLVAFVPTSFRVPSWAIRLVWVGLAILIPLIVGLSLAAKAPVAARREASVWKVLRGFPITIGLAAAFLIMFATVPLIRLAAILRGRKSADIPLMTDESAYHDVAVKLCEVLNRHGFSFQRAEPGWWVTAPTRILTWLGGDAFRSYVPTRLEHFVSPDIEMSLYPSGLLLRGKRGRLTWARGLIAETVTHAEGLQTVDAEAQSLEKRLRRLWKTFDETAVANRGSPALVRRLEEATRDLGKLEVDFDDWQVLYRQILQVGRAIDGQRQLLDALATAPTGGAISKAPSLPLPFGLRSAARANDQSADGAAVASQRTRA